MTDRHISLALGIAVVAIVGVVVYLQLRGSETEATPPQSAGATYTAAQVAAHADASSCWTIIDASVYDLTEWIAQHPGGAQAILVLCGTDGTVSFRGQHGAAQQQAAVLATYKIGELADEI